MIVFYDATGEAHPLSVYEDFCIKHKLDGCDEMSFCVDTRLEQYGLLYEEARVITDDNEWLIKKIDDDKIDCKLDFDFLKKSIHRNYKSETRSLQEVLESHLPEDWTIEGANVSSIRRTIEFDFCTDYDIVYECMSTYEVYLVWKLKEKRVIVHSQKLMPSTGRYLTSELNLKKLSFKGDTTEFATRLYAYGKDGLSIADALVLNDNGSTVKYGLPYVENKEYVDKVVCAYWEDDRYTVAENLLEATKEKLVTLSHPVRSYECDVIDLAKLNDEYSFLDFEMHKKVTLIDVERNIKVEHQIVEYVEYPDEETRNKVTLSCVPQTIKSSMSSAISSMKDANEKMKTSFEERILMATAMLTGAFGGYLKSDGSEIFIMDKEDPAQAQVVWRWNINGFGKSSTGIEGPYTTALTFDDRFITSVIDAMVIRGSLIEAGSIKSEAISQEYKDEVADEVGQAISVLEQSLLAKDGQFMSEIKQTFENSYVTRTLFNQTTEEINTEVNKKVNDTDFGTKITQNATSVRIAWNNISNYIQFENGELRVYDSNDKSTQQLVSAFNYMGEHFYREGTYIGKIGTNNWVDDDSYRGLVFDLEPTASYMCWAAKDSASDDYFDVKLIYHHKTSKGKKGLHLGCDFFANGCKIDAANLTDVRSDGYKTFNGTIRAIHDISGDTFYYKDFTVKNGLILG